MGDPGLEPGAYQLKAEYSTVELVTLPIYNIIKKSIFCKMSVLKDEWKPFKENFMNSNVLSQLLTVFTIVTMGPAVVAYLAYKKAL